MENRAGVAGSFIFIIFAFLYFIWLSPLMTDNFVFSRELVPGYASYFNGEKVTASPLTLAGAFRQTWNMYYGWCGRFVGNLVVYLFFLLPRWLYCLVAACGFGLYVWLLQISIFGRFWRQNLTPGWIFGLAALLWLTIPSFGEAFFWLSVGGEWALLGQIAVLLPFRFALDDSEHRPNSAKPFLVYILYFLGCVCAASLDYATSAGLPLTALLCVVWLWRKSGRMPMLLVWGAAGLWTGSLLTLGAPGNAQRLALTNDEAVQAWLGMGPLERLLDWASHLPGLLCMEYVPLVIFSWSCIVLLKNFGRGGIARHISMSAWLFIFPAVLIWMSYMFTSWPPPRAFAGSTALLLAGSLIMAIAAKNASGGQWNVWFRVLRAALCIICTLTIIMEGIKFYQLHEIIAQREEALNSGSMNVIVPRLPVGSGDRYWVLGKYLNDLSVDPEFWVNRAVALHYGIQRVQIPPEPVRDWRNENGAVNIVLKDNVLHTKWADRGEPPKNLHIYFWGRNALIEKLPACLGKWVMEKLAESKGKAIQWLVPILFTRSDITLHPNDSGLFSGISEFLEIFSDRMLWLVRPGADKYSTDLSPLEKSQQ